MDYRVGELATAAGVSVAALRAYQSKRLLPPPRRDGRHAIYGPAHLERLRAIADLKRRGHTLRAIRTMLAGPPAGAPAGPPAGARPARPGPAGTPDLTLAELAERARVAPALLRSLEAAGVLQPLRGNGDRPYTAADVQALRMLQSLVGGGVPLDEFMAVARTQIEAATAVAERALSLFLLYVRAPLLDRQLPPDEEADRLMHALAVMVQAATGLIVYNIQRTMVNRAEEEIDQRGTPAERAALRRDIARRRFEAVPLP